MYGSEGAVQLWTEREKDRGGPPFLNGGAEFRPELNRQVPNVVQKPVCINASLTYTSAVLFIFWVL